MSGLQRLQIQMLNLAENDFFIFRICNFDMIAAAVL